MLSKKKIAIGDIVVIDKPRDGVTLLGAFQERPFVQIWGLGANDNMGLGPAKINGKPGELLKLLSKPRRRNNINLIRVLHIESGKEGEVYWCELRASCKPAPTSNTNGAQK